MAQSSSTELAAAHAPDEHDAAYDEMAARRVSAACVLGLYRPSAGRIVLAFLLIALAAAPFLLREIIDVALPQDDLRLLTALAASLIGLAAAGAAIGVPRAVVGSGTHEALLARAHAYARLVRKPA